MVTSKPTEKQIAARNRNNRIWLLRGLWSQQYLLTGERRAAAQALVDAELELIGAEPEGVRQKRRRDELFSDLEQEQQQ